MRSILITFFVLIHLQAKAQDVHLKFFLNDKEFNPLTENKSLDPNTIIKIKILGSDKNALYKFGDIYAERVLRKDLPYKSRNDQQRQEVRIKEKRKKEKLSKYISVSNKYEASPALIIPYSKFHDPCLSRVIFQVTRVYLKKDNSETVIDPSIMRYEQEYSFWSSWACE
jgi:hypothetical protein